MSPRVEHIGDATLYLGDCLEILPTLGPFDAVVTSPPYDNLRDYGGHEAPDLLAVIERIARLLTVGGVCVWNVADATIDGSETGSSFRQALQAKASGLRIHDTMIYCKEGVTFPDAGRYHPAFEYMFVFSQGKPKHFNGIRDWPNKWAGTPMHGTDRNADGSTSTISGVGKPVPKLGLRRNWWVLSNAYNGNTKGHPAPMPYRMASDHVETWTDIGDTVADPFMGSGTTGVACAKLGRKFIGIEIEPKYFDIACKRIEEAYAQPDMFVQAPEPKPTQDTFDLEGTQ